MMRKILIYMLVVMALGGFGSSRYVTADETNDSYSYAFHLYYDAGKLSVDRNAKNPYDILAQETAVSTEESNTSFRAEIVNFKEQIKQTVFFDLDPTFKGSFAVEAQYISDGQEINFYSPSGQKLLTIPLGTSAVCNDNNTCESNAGESFDNCPTDCKAIVPSVVTQPPTASTTPSQAASSRGLTIGLSVLVIILLGGAGAWIIIRRRRVVVIPPSQPPVVK